ncbi:ASCH domain protein [Pseudobythopirellula maris]|uniref:ASCH domain protein n=1 Tax=Pseudobythopirellula maris TaxID=2527991 RepID=A0A5C5ZU01_9BACT|nr:ASCH domain-containing protein [Pseudobythopirellula maris]TWT90547.1 ASCH domain protein [Pseudobythopirellula maris]
MLLFKKKFLHAIRSGEKTQTIRLWSHRMMRTGQRSYIPGAGYARVTLVEGVDLDDLTDHDARPDGFATADELRQELTAIYGDKLAAGYQAFRVVFHLEPQGDAKEETAATEAAR